MANSIVLTSVDSNPSERTLQRYCNSWLCLISNPTNAKGTFHRDNHNQQIALFILQNSDRWCRERTAAETKRMPVVDGFHQDAGSGIGTDVQKGVGSLDPEDST